MDAYDGLKDGYYIIVGGIVFDPRNVKKLALYKAAKYRTPTRPKPPSTPAACISTPPTRKLSSSSCVSRSAPAPPPTPPRSCTSSIAAAPPPLFSPSNSTTRANSARVNGAPGSTATHPSTATPPAAPSSSPTSTTTSSATSRRCTTRSSPATGADVAYLYVLPRYRRQGIGGTLLIAAARWLQADGIARVTVDCFAKDPTRSFFHRLGAFVIASTADNSDPAAIITYGFANLKELPSKALKTRSIAKFQRFKDCRWNKLPKY